jgi:hypothetical protein
MPIYRAPLRHCTFVVYLDDCFLLQDTPFPSCQTALSNASHGDRQRGDVRASTSAPLVQDSAAESQRTPPTQRFLIGSKEGRRKKFSYGFIDKSVGDNSDAEDECNKSEAPRP